MRELVLAAVAAIATSSGAVQAALIQIDFAGTVNFDGGTGYIGDEAFVLPLLPDYAPTMLKSASVILDTDAIAFDTGLKTYRLSGAYYVGPTDKSDALASVQILTDVRPIATTSLIVRAEISESLEVLTARIDYDENCCTQTISGSFDLGRVDYSYTLYDTSWGYSEYDWVTFVWSGTSAWSSQVLSNPAPVPLPASAALLTLPVLAGMALGWRRRR